MKVSDVVVPASRRRAHMPDQDDKSSPPASGSLPGSLPRFVLQGAMPGSTYTRSELTAPVADQLMPMASPAARAATAS